MNHGVLSLTHTHVNRKRSSELRVMICTVRFGVGKCR